MTQFTQLFKMKNLLQILLIIITNVMSLHSQNNNFHLNWESDNRALSFLRGERLFKLEFNLDKYTVAEVDNQKHYEVSTPCAKYPIPRAFEKAFNEKVSGKFVAKYLTDESYIYTYQIKITPISFIKNYLRYTNGASSTYVKGAYLIEIFDCKHTEPIFTMKLTNLTNKYPMNTNSTITKIYGGDMDDEINKNIERAGTETSKYLLKLIRQSPKVKKN
jgi:hypothetical protein